MPSRPLPAHLDDLVGKLASAVVANRPALTEAQAADVGGSDVRDAVGGAGDGGNVGAVAEGGWRLLGVRHSLTVGAAPRSNQSHCQQRDNQSSHTQWSHLQSSFTSHKSPR